MHPALPTRPALFAGLVLTLSAVACRGPELAEVQAAPPPAPALAEVEPLDPRIAAEQAMADYIDAQGGGGVPDYRDARTDLDGDGTADLVALIDDPVWCGPDGCPLLVFQGQADGSYRLVGRTDTTRAPIALGKQRNNGWHDLLVGVGGGTTQSGTVALQFDGEGYPGDPTLVALLADNSVPGARTLIDE